MAGTIYHWMLLNASLGKHVEEFIDTMKDLPGFAKRFKKYPDRYFAAWTLTIINGIFSGVSAVFFFEQLTKLFPLLPEKIISPLVGVIGINTFINTLFTRFLSTSNQFLAIDFEKLSPQQRQQVNGWGVKFAFDIFLNIAQAAAVGIIVKEQIFLKFPFNYIVPLSATALSLIIGSATYYGIRRDQKAVALFQPKLEEQAGVESGSVSIGQLSNKYLYNTLVKNQNFNLKKVTALIFTGLLLEATAFFLFANTLSNPIKMKLTPYAYFALVNIIILGSITSNFRFFDNAIHQVFAEYSANKKLLNAREKLSQSSILTKGWFALTRPLRASLVSGGNFSKNELQACAEQEIKKSESEETAPLITSPPSLRRF